LIILVLVVLIVSIARFRAADAIRANKRGTGVWKDTSDSVVKDVIAYWIAAILIAKDSHVNRLSFVRTSNVRVVHITISILDLLATKVCLHKHIICAQTILGGGAVAPSVFGVAVADAGVLRVVIGYQVCAVRRAICAENFTVVLKRVHLRLGVGVDKGTRLNNVIATLAVCSAASRGTELEPDKRIVQDALSLVVERRHMIAPIEPERVVRHPRGVKVGIVIIVFESTSDELLPAR
jgi:hypothetical protein